MYVGPREGGLQLKDWFRNLVIALGLLSWIGSGLGLMKEYNWVIGVMWLAVMCFGIERKKGPLEAMGRKTHKRKP